MQVRGNLPPGSYTDRDGLTLHVKAPATSTGYSASPSTANRLVLGWAAFPP